MENTKQQVNRFKAWTSENIIELKSGVVDNKPIAEMATSLGRTERAIECAIEKYIIVDLHKSGKSTDDILNIYAGSTLINKENIEKYVSKYDAYIKRKQEERNNKKNNKAAAIKPLTETAPTSDVQTENINLRLDNINLRLDVMQKLLEKLEYTITCNMNNNTNNTVATYNYSHESGCMGV